MLSKLLQLLRMGDIRVDKEKPLEGEDLNYVLVSALEASKHFAFLNTFKTGLSDREIKTIVHEQWQIKERDEALEVLSNLIKQNQDINLETVYLAAGKLNHEKYLKEHLPEDKIAYQHYLATCEELKKIIPPLTQAKIIIDYKEAAIFKDTAYNMARGALLARCCLDLGLFTEMVTKSILIGLHKELKQSCKTWDIYIKSYILGRTLNGYNDFKDIKYLGHKLLTNSKSPLNQRVII